MYSTSLTLYTVRVVTRIQFTAAEKKELLVSYKQPSISECFDPARYKVQINGKYRWEDGVIKEAGMALENDLFKRLGMEKLASETEAAFSARLWARANAPETEAFGVWDADTEDTYINTVADSRLTNNVENKRRLEDAVKEEADLALAISRSQENGSAFKVRHPPRRVLGLPLTVMLRRWTGH